MTLRSPVTHSENCVKVYQFDNNRIKERYKELGIDVSRFIDNREISLWQCNDTHYRFYYPFDIFGDELFYEELQKQLPWYYKEEKYEHDESLAKLNAGEKVLEIGCGSGKFLDMCRLKGIKTTGLEFNDNAIAICYSKGLTVYKESIQYFAAEKKCSFDAVCFFQVLEHITDIKSFLDAAIFCLKPQGKLIIAVPNNNPFIFKRDIYHTLNLPPHHAGLWNRKAFETLPKHFPIQITEVKVEPMTEYKSWFLVQKEHLKKEKPLFGTFLSLVPRPLYKAALHLFRSKIEGRNIIVTFQKKD